MQIHVLSHKNSDGVIKEEEEEDEEDGEEDKEWWQAGGEQRGSEPREESGARRTRQVLFVLYSGLTCILSALSLPGVRPSLVQSCHLC